jgi:hypothetical protein
MKELSASKKSEIVHSVNGTSTPTNITEEVDREGNILTKAALTIAELGKNSLPPFRVYSPI